jgi:hypothetical protein
LLEPHNAATLNLVEKIETVRQPLRFTPAGTYHLEYTNDQTGEVQKTDLIIEAEPDAQLRGKKTDPGEASALVSVVAGGNRLWAVADTPFGQLEFRIIVEDGKLSGYWAGPYGHNGKLSGSRIE